VSKRERERERAVIVALRVGLNRSGVEFGGYSWVFAQGDQMLDRVESIMSA
jgi:hypothetical protein